MPNSAKTKLKTFLLIQFTVGGTVLQSAIPSKPVFRDLFFDYLTKHVNLNFILSNAMQGVHPSL